MATSAGNVVHRLIENYDVVAVGGGPAGSVAALSLVRAGYSVAVLERSDYLNPRVGETLPPAVKAPLVSLRLWDVFLKDSHSQSPAIYSAWGSETLHEQNHLYSPYGLGWHIDRRQFDETLARAARNEGATVKTGTRVVNCEWDRSGGWAIGLCSGHTYHRVRARFLLDATGRPAAIARQLGVRRVVDDYLIGVVGLFNKGPEAQEPTPSTLVEAVENGWWYAALLPDSRLISAYMTDADVYAKGQRHSARKWLEQLDRTVHTKSRANGWILNSGPFVVSANSSRLSQMSGDGWLALGDAALAFDPIAGQGVFRALESAIHAADAVQGCLAAERGQLANYADTLGRLYDQFLTLRARYYSLEKRWPNSVFWRRRQARLIRMRA